MRKTRLLTGAGAAAILVTAVLQPAYAADEDYGADQPAPTAEDNGGVGDGDMPADDGPDGDIGTPPEPSDGGVGNDYEVPGDEVPGDDVPGDDVPGDDVPGDDVPGDDVPGDEVPGDDVPDTDSTDGPPEPSNGGVGNGYDEEPLPTRAAGVCVGDVPYFAYEVDFGDDDFVGDAMTITFVNPDGDDAVIETTVPAAGERGVVLWPGASEDPQDWPGWELNEDGVWVETTEDEGAFTRAPGGVEVLFETNPTLDTTVTYPPASAICANPKNRTPRDVPPPPGDNPPPPGEDVPPPPGEHEDLPETGADTRLIGLSALAALGAGIGMTAAVRRRWAQL